jgi:hypothetical protein
MDLGREGSPRVTAATVCKTIQTGQPPFPPQKGSGVLIWKAVEAEEREKEEEGEEQEEKEEAEEEQESFMEEEHTRRRAGSAHVCV